MLKLYISVYFCATTHEEAIVVNQYLLRYFEVSVIAHKYCASIVNIKSICLLRFGLILGRKHTSAKKKTVHNFMPLRLARTAGGAGIGQENYIKIKLYCMYRF